MERKIGEIFEYNGEWYQCLESDSCRCDYCDYLGDCNKIACTSGERSDDKEVCFKKLEKVGEPYVGNNGTFQSYKLAMPIYGDIPDQITGFTTTEVVIKQNEEDMEERELDPRMAKVIDEAAQKLGDEISKQLKENLNKQRMKPFNLEAAKAGKPVCTRNGRKARIICFDKKCLDEQILIVLVDCGKEECMYFYTTDGKCIDDFSSFDLMMLPEKKEGWVNLYKSSVWSTKEEAMKYRNKCNDYIDTIKISWEE